MDKSQQIANSLLWAAAIIGSAILNDNSFFSVILLPGLAVAALLNSNRGCCLPRKNC